MAEPDFTDEEKISIRAILLHRTVDAALQAQKDAADAAIAARQAQLRSDVEKLPEYAAVLAAKDKTELEAASDSLYKSQSYIDLVTVGDAEVAQLTDSRKALG